MKYPAMVCGLALFLAVPIAVVRADLGPDSVSTNDKYRKDAVDTMAVMRTAIVQLNADRKDVADIQSKLDSPEGSAMTFQARQSLRTRMSSDQADIQTQTEVIIRDLDLLRENWAVLTPDEQKYVTDTERSMKP